MVGGSFLLYHAAKILEFLRANLNILVILVILGFFCALKLALQAAFKKVLHIVTPLFAHRYPLFFAVREKNGHKKTMHQKTKCE